MILSFLPDVPGVYFGLGVVTGVALFPAGRSVLRKIGNWIVGEVAGIVHKKIVAGPVPVTIPAKTVTVDLPVAAADIGPKLDVTAPAPVAVTAAVI